MLDLAAKVKEVYFEIYGGEIPVFINKNEIVTDFLSNKNTNKVTSISNKLIKQYSFDLVKKKLKDGIKDLFLYLENQSKV